MNFSVNQNRQVYVANEALNYSTTAPKAANLKDGDVVVVSKDITNVKGGKDALVDKGEFFIAVKKGDNLYRSDVIKACHVTSFNYTEAKDLNIKAPKVEVTLPETIIPGADYVLKITVKQGVSLFGEKNAYVYASEVAQSGDKDALGKALVANLKANLSHEPESPFSSVKYDDGKLTFVGKLRSWRLGLGMARATDFDVTVLPVRYNDIDVIWAKKDDKTIVKTWEDVAPNSTMVADLEYFAIGERGDQYRENCHCFPAILSDLRVDPKAENGYDILTIHFFDEHGTSFKSEKEIQVLVKA